VRSETLHHIIPRDNAPDKSILKQATAVNLLRAIKKRNTHVVLLHREEGMMLFRILSCSFTSLVQSIDGNLSSASILAPHGGWKVVTMTHRANTADEALILHWLSCISGGKVSCSQSIERAVQANSLKDTLSENWNVCEEAPLASTGLSLQREQLQLALVEHK
jgi:hypothetical protein